MKKNAKKKNGSKLTTLKNRIRLKIREKTPVRRVAKRAAKESKAPVTPSPIPLQELKINEAKFYTGAAEPVYQQTTISELEHRELPGQYNEDTLVLQTRDPWWAHAYWDVSSLTFDRLQRELGHDLSQGRWMLRSYDISFIHFDGTNAHRFFDTAVAFDARNWYLNFGAPGTSWCADLGLLLPDPDSRFITVVRSNTISLPLDGPSWITDEEWMIPDDEFRRLYGMSVGLGPNISSPVGKLWQERLKRDISSGGLASMASPVKKIEKEKGAFWLVVDTELIVYGATEPDANVTVQGKPISLRKDGTFTLRFALPDGRQVIPVEATSAKTKEQRSITPTVTRKTTRNP